MIHLSSSVLTNSKAIVCVHDEQGSHQMTKCAKRRHPYKLPFNKYIVYDEYEDLRIVCCVVFFGPSQSDMNFYIEFAKVI